MGIRGAKRLLQAQAKPVDTTELQQFSEIPVDISLDGLSLLYESLTPENLKVTTDPSYIDGYDENLMTESTYKMTYNYVNEIQLQCPVYRVKIYIDGPSPSLKSKNMSANRKFDLNLAIELMCQKIIQRLPFNGESKVIKLPFGEAEYECFLRRDVSRPNILRSRDSDLFHICYGYQKQTANDAVFYFNPDWNCMYNMSEINLNMPKLVCSTILFLKGTDLTKKILDEDKCMKVFQLFKNEFKNISKENIIAIMKEIEAVRHICRKYHDKERKIQSMITEKIESQSIDGLYEIGDVEKIVKSLEKIIRTAQRKKKYSANNNVSSVFAVPEDDLKIITWSANYSLIGARLIGYHTRNSG
ncbi:unnamed protein product [Ceutorhynchus assimilis]|uniref:Uncharacterized protein n=1 Tax=Ceutorhynchus assimilis TaxID=467358 RepID=A0A9N9QRQ1_9CUCU|nr:unnamed protein product [Ceutorhynchus assimilis]